jgi:hypothetical protein
LVLNYPLDTGGRDPCPTLLSAVRSSMRFKQQSDLVAVVREQGVFLKRRGRTYLACARFVRSGRRRSA